MTKRLVTLAITLAAIVSISLFSTANVVWSNDSEEAESYLSSKTIIDLLPHWATSTNWKNPCRSSHNWQFNSHVGFRLGYRRTRLAISFPSNQADFPGGPHFLTTELDLKNADDATVSLDLEYLPISTFGIFGRADLNHPTSHTMSMQFTGALDRTAGPGSMANAVSPWDWKALQYQWWTLEGGLQLGLTDDYWVLVGFRTERFDLTLKNPVTRHSVALGGSVVSPIRLLQRGDATGELRGDLEITAYVPFIGIGGNAGKGGSVSSKWRIIGTPYGWTDIRMPFTIKAMSPGGSEIATSTYNLATEQSILVEADFETTFSFNSILSTTLWVTGSFFKCQGNGRMKTTVTASNFFGVFEGTFPYENAQLNRSFYSLGLSMDIRF